MRECNTNGSSKQNGNGSSGRANSSVKTWGRYTAAGALFAATYCSLSGAATASLSIKAQTPRTKGKFLAWDFVDAAKQVPGSMRQLIEPQPGEPRAHAECPYRNIDIWVGRDLDKQLANYLSPSTHEQ